MIIGPGPPRSGAIRPIPMVCMTWPVTSGSGWLTGTIHDYYAVSPTEDPQGPATGTVKVLRGGAWLLFPEFCRVSYRFRNNPNFRFNLIGFRLAKSA